MGEPMSADVLLDLPLYADGESAPVSVGWLYDVCDVIPGLRYSEGEESGRLACAAVFFLRTDRSLQAAGLGANPSARQALEVLTRNLCGRGTAELEDLVDARLARELDVVIDGIVRTSRRESRKD